MGMLEGVDDFRIYNIKEIINKIKTIMRVYMLLRARKLNDVQSHDHLTLKKHGI